MKKKKTIAAALVLLLVFFVGGAVAYFTDTDTATNTFTIGNVDISLSEPSWVPADAQNLMPGEEIAKDPKITNDSTTNSAFVFMEVVSPCTTDTPAVELFPYTAKSGWYLMTSNPACSAGTITRRYAYGTSTAMTPLTAGSTTPTLFDSVTLDSNIDGSETGISGNLNMVITGYGIQVDGLSATDPTSVWSNFS